MPIISRRKNFDRTTGIYGHLPKFWNCKKVSDNLKERRDKDLWSPDGWNDYVSEHKENHQSCKFGVHVSDVGYVRIVGRENTYTLWYMGNPYRHKIFEKNSRFLF